MAHTIVLMSLLKKLSNRWLPKALSLIESNVRFCAPLNRFVNITFANRAARG